MRCEICAKELLPENHTVICSEKCAAIRLAIYAMIDKYAPCNGCDNCWGDGHGNCTSKCQEEFKKSRELSMEIHSLLDLIYPERKREL